MNLEKLAKQCWAEVRRTKENLEQSKPHMADVEVFYKSFTSKRKTKENIGTLIW